MLLSHTAGFPNWRRFTDAGKLAINFEPGSRYAYSGEGIDLLQLVVETVARKPLEEVMQKRVFTPLQMTRTSMVWQERFEDDYANGYDEVGRSLGPQRRKSADAAGSMQTTLRDFSRFMGAVMRGEGLRQKTRELMLSPQISDHLQTSISDARKRTDGRKQSYSPQLRTCLGALLDTFDEPKTGMVIMTNSANGEGIFKELLETLLADTFTPIEWEGYTPYDQLPPKKRIE